MPEQAAGRQSIGLVAEDAVAPMLEDLVPLAAVIGAGCEPCAASLVERALQREGERPALERTLRILAGVARAECLADNVGPEVIERMKRSLRAGRQALDRGEPVRQTSTSCARSLQPPGDAESTRGERK